MTTVTAATAAIRMFIHAATILRRTQTRELLSPLSQAATRPGQPGSCRATCGSGSTSIRSGASVLIGHPLSPPCLLGAARAHFDTGRARVPARASPVLTARARASSSAAATGRAQTRVIGDTCGCRMTSARHRSAAAYWPRSASSLARQAVMYSRQVS